MSRARGFAILFGVVVLLGGALAVDWRAAVIVAGLLLIIEGARR